MTETYQQKMLREDCESVAAHLRPVTVLAKGDMLDFERAFRQVAKARVALDAVRDGLKRMWDESDDPSGG